ncbi:MAG TPA: tripartite tricarboxylate transporter TctB family protein [Reyranella sp.]|nr:tripartite tricarboxylate transporter TctB family protein [Reyranella sp.]
MNRFLSKDFLSGVMFIAFGLAALWFGRHLAMGTSVRMGPGYVPHMLAYIMMVLGLIIAVSALYTGGAAEAAFEVAGNWTALIAITVATAACVLLGAYVSYYALLAGVAVSFAILSFINILPGAKLRTIGLAVAGCVVGGVVYNLVNQDVGMAVSLVLCALAIQWPPESKVKPLFMVTVGIVTFALLFETTGMLPSLIALVLIASLGGDEFRLKEVAGNIVVLTILCILVFKVGLSMNISVINGVW